MLTAFSDDFKILFRDTKKRFAPCRRHHLSITEGKGITGALCAGKPCPVLRSRSATN
jgi:hypothetical protein